MFQNYIWDYAYKKDGMIMKEKLEPDYVERINLTLNLDMVNAVIALLVAFFYPRTAFFLLFFKLPNFVFAGFYIRRKLKEAKRNLKINP